MLTRNIVRTRLSPGEIEKIILTQELLEQSLSLDMNNVRGQDLTDTSSSWLLRNQLTILIVSMDFYLFGNEDYHLIAGRYDSSLDRRLEQEDGYFAGKYLPPDSKNLHHAIAQAEQTSEIVKTDFDHYENTLRHNWKRAKDKAEREEYVLRYVYKLRRSLTAHRNRLGDHIKVLELSLDVAKIRGDEHGLSGFSEVLMKDFFGTVMDASHMAKACIPISVGSIYNISKELVLERAEHYFDLTR